jgi:Arc/MetJ-type ribon-helix-helix transcriptional regulator
LYALSMTAKSRLSVTVDADLIAVVHAAVAAGSAESMSAWVSDALRLKLEHDRRLRGIGDFIAAYEAEHGEITEEEMEAAVRRARERAIVVRGGKVVRNGMTGTSQTGTE